MGVFKRPLCLEGRKEVRCQQEGLGGGNSKAVAIVPTRDDGDLKQRGWRRDKIGEFLEIFMSVPEGWIGE